jgi:hypothetical protein
MMRRLPPAKMEMDGSGVVDTRSSGLRRPAAWAGEWARQRDPVFIQHTGVRRGGGRAGGSGVAQCGTEEKISPALFVFGHLR